jgi:glutathione S-transferase
MAEKFTLGLDYPNLPYFIDGNVKLSQSVAIMRHLGRLYKLNGQTPEEECRVDQAELQIIDFRLDIIKLFYNDWDNTEAKANFLNPEERNSLPYFYKLFENVLKEREFIAGDSVTYPDFLLWECLDYVLYAFPSFTDAFPSVKAYYGRIDALPGMTKLRASDKWMEWPLVSSYAKFGFKEEDKLGRYPK